MHWRKKRTKEKER